MRKLTVSRVRNDANEARIPHTHSHTHPREARPRAPRRLAGPVRGEQHRGARGSELWSIDLQLVVINPMVLFHFSTSPLGQSPLCQRRTDPAIPRPNPSARLAKEMPKSRGITTSVASRGHGGSSSLSSPRPTGHIGEVRGVAGNKQKTATGPRLTRAKRQVFPRFMPLRGDAFPAVVTESSERHERDQKRAQKAWLVALSALRQSCSSSMALAGIARLLGGRA